MRNGSRIDLRTVSSPHSTRWPSRTMHAATLPEMSGRDEHLLGAHIGVVGRDVAASGPSRGRLPTMIAIAGSSPKQIMRACRAQMLAMNDRDGCVMMRRRAGVRLIAASEAITLFQLY